MYVTFGTNGQIYDGGWIRINAENREEAIEKMIERYGEENFNEHGLYRFAFMYTEEEFKETEMYQNGNMGVYEHEYLE